jgi:hypothetical protein
MIKVFKIVKTDADIEYWASSDLDMSDLMQRNYIELALRSFLRLEYHCFVKGISWFEAKASIVRNAIRVYLAKPIYACP